MEQFMKLLENTFCQVDFCYYFSLDSYFVHHKKRKTNLLINDIIRINIMNFFNPQIKIKNRFIRYTSSVVETDMLGWD